LCCSSSLSLWSFLVLGTLSAICYFKTYLPPTALILFFISSVIGGLLFLAGTLSLDSTVRVLVIGLLLKLGFAPFHFWTIKVTVFLRGFPLFFFLSVLKIGPLFLLVHSCGSILFWSAFSFIVGLLLIWTGSSSSFVLLGSGLAQFTVLCSLPTLLFWPYLLSYFLRLLLCCSSSALSVSALVAYLSLSGIPPFPFFISKLLALVFCSFPAGIVILLVSSVSFLPYLWLGLISNAHTTSSFSFVAFLVLCFSYLLSICFPLI